jgi:hypothetical protein
MEATEDGDGSHTASSSHAANGDRVASSFARDTGDLLRQALMRTVVVEKPHVFAQDAPQVGLAKDQDMVEAFPTNAAQKPLAGGILPGSAVGRPQLRDPARRRDPGKRWAVLAVVVAD